MPLAKDSWVLRPKKKLKYKSFFDMKPVKAEGPDAAHISENIDEIVYS